MSTHVQHGLYSQLKQMTISEKDNLAALSLSTLMLTGENVRSSAIYAFDRMMARETRPLEAFATFAEIFDFLFPLHNRMLSCYLNPICPKIQYNSVFHLI